jgi:heterodisulfide reductase subunit D
MAEQVKLGVFFGCTTTGAPHLLEGLEGFLRKAKIDYAPLGKNLCCGVPLKLSGYHDEAAGFAKKVAEKLKASGITQLVTSCPHCYMMLRCEYPDEFGIELPFEVLHFVEFADGLLKRGEIKLKNRKQVKIFYHDSCGIGRRGPGLYDEPRRVLESCVRVIEANRNKVLGTCCGGGGLLRASLPKLAVAAATRKIRDDVLPKGIDTIVTSCPFCTLNLAEGAEEIREKDINVFDLPQFLSDNMKEVN